MRKTRNLTCVPLDPCRVLRFFIFAITLITAATGLCLVSPAVGPAAGNSGPYTSWPRLYVDPPTTTCAVGESFTVSLRIFNLTRAWTVDPTNPNAVVPLGNLYGFDLNFTWDPAILQYVNHTLTVPVEQYPDGVLHDMILAVRDHLNSTNGSYRLVMSSYSPDSPPHAFNNPDKSSSFFNITFRAKRAGASSLALVPVSRASTPEQPAKLASIDGRLIVYNYVGGSFRTEGAPEARFAVSPSDGYAVVNKPVAFNGSTSSGGMEIVLYMWDFGDGNLLNTTEPTINHSYASFGLYKPRLRVMDDSAIFSIWATGEPLQIVARRDVMVVRFRFSSQPIVSGGILPINVTVSNEGDAPESFSVSVYHNSTKDPWVLLGEKRIENLGPHCAVEIAVGWNTTYMPRGTTHHRFLANATAIPCEEDDANNRLESGTIEVTQGGNSTQGLGDVNGDGQVDASDVLAARSSYDSREGDQNWNGAADLAPPHGSTDIYDIATIIYHYGKTYP